MTVYLFDYVVFEPPQAFEPIEKAYLGESDLEFMRHIIFGGRYPQIDVPTKDFFTDIRGDIWKGIYEEVAPFPNHRGSVALRFLLGKSLRSVYDLRPQKGLKPFSATRTPRGIEVKFINTEAPRFYSIEKPHCTHICGIDGSYQCAKWGSWCQIELRHLLPMWSDMCTMSSARDCPMRLSACMPAPSSTSDLFINFYEWCETRNRTSCQKTSERDG